MKGIHMLVTLFAVSGSFIPGYAQSNDPLLLWSQRSHIWSKVRGIPGDPNSWISNQYSYQNPYRQTESIANTFRYGLSYHPLDNTLCWGDRAQNKILKQSLETSLNGRVDDIEELLYIPQAVIGAVAVDWVAGNVYFTELSAPFIGVQKWNGRNVYKMLFSNQLAEPEGLAIDPYEGYIFWSNNHGHSRIERSTTDGSERSAIRTDVNHPVGLTLDLATKHVYWVDKVTSELWKMNYDGDWPDQLHRSNTAKNYFGVAILRDYIFITTGDHLTIDIHRRNGDHVSSADIDAYVYHIMALDYDVIPDPHDCTEMGCQHLCLSLGNGNGKCACAENYVLLPDGRSCAESHPVLVYTKRSSLIVSSAQIDTLNPNQVNMNSTVIKQDAQDARAVATHYEKGLVFFSDITTDMIYSTNIKGSTLRDITANTRRVEGLAVDWRSDILFWSDNDLKYIMAAKVTGHLHRKHVGNTGNAQGLVVDSTLDRLIWVVKRSDTEGSIEAIGLDGQNRQVLVGGSSGSFRDLAVDPVTERLYWSNTGVLESSDLQGQNRRMLEARGSTIYGLTLFGEYMVYTTEADSSLKFWNDRTKQQIGSANIRNTWTGSRDDSSTKHYGVTVYDARLQPAVSNGCTSQNGGCSQLCFPSRPDQLCACAIGYALSGYSSCVSDIVDNKFLLFVDPYHRQIYQMNKNHSDLNSMHTQGVPVSQMEFPVSVDFDLASRRVYWLDTHNHVIKSANLDGTNSKTILSLSSDKAPQRVVVDSGARYVFYTEQVERAIYRMDVDGSNRKRFVTTDGDPLGLAVDYSNGHLYWGTNKPSVWRAEVDDAHTQQLITDRVSRPQALAFSNTEMKLFIGDRSDRRIYSVDVNGTTLFNLVPEYDWADDVYSLAVDHEYLYYSTWSGKSVNAINRENKQKTELDEPLFARVTDLKAINDLLPYIPPVPVKADDDDTMIIIIAAAAAAAFLLLLGLLFLLLCCCKKRKSKETPSISSGSAGFDSVNDAEFDLYSSAGMAERGNSTHSPPRYNRGDSNSTSSTEHSQTTEDASSTAELVRETSNRSTNRGYNNNSFSNGISILPVAAPPLEKRFTRKSKKSGKSKGPVASRISSGNTNEFQLQGDKKVATIIQRLASRLRKGLNSLNFKEPEPRPRIPDTIDSSYDAEADLSGNPDFGAHTAKKTPEKTKVHIPDHLHPPPRGWAPASNFVPRTTKPTSWGRAKGVLAKPNTTQTMNH